MIRTPKQEFAEMIAEINRMKGLDDLSSRIIGMLYAEPLEVAMEDLASATGYSLSAVSTSMKLLEGGGIVKRIRKPGSRKVYFYMEKDMLGTFIELLARLQKLLDVARARMPGIIERYKTVGPAANREEAVIAENYYRQIHIAGRVMKRFMGLLEEEHVRVCGKR